jgi:hypothetical protein
MPNGCIFIGKSWQEIPLLPTPRFLKSLADARLSKEER